MSHFPERREYHIFEKWLQAYGQAWQETDLSAFARLFTSDARYFWTPFEKPLNGREQISTRVEAAFARQKNIHFRYTVIDWTDRSGTAHWICTFERKDGSRVTVDGMLRAIIDQDGLCEEFREWWHSSES